MAKPLSNLLKLVSKTAEQNSSDDILQHQDADMKTVAQNVVLGKTLNQLNDLRIIICLRKPEVSVRRNSVCNVIENLAEHGIHCLPCSYLSNVILTSK